MARIAIDSEFEAFASEVYTVTRNAGRTDQRTFKTTLQVSVAPAGGLDALGLRNRDATVYATGRNAVVVGDEFTDGPITYVVWEGMQTGGERAAFNIRRVPPLQTFTLRSSTPGTRDPNTKELATNTTTGTVLAYVTPGPESFSRRGSEESLTGPGTVISRAAIARGAILEHAIIGVSRVVQARPYGPWWQARLEVVK